MQSEKGIVKPKGMHLLRSAKAKATMCMDGVAQDPERTPCPTQTLLLSHAMSPQSQLMMGRSTWRSSSRLGGISRTVLGVILSHL